MKTKESWRNSGNIRNLLEYMAKQRWRVNVKILTHKVMKSYNRSRLEVRGHMKEG